MIKEIDQFRKSIMSITPKRLPAYEPPAIISYADEEILEALGPALAGSPGSCPSGSICGNNASFFFDEEEEE